jgi:CheY-like chemotaxis protein
MSGVLSNTTILVVDEDADIGVLLRVVLGTQGAKVEYATNVPMAIQVCEQVRPHVIIADLQLRGYDGCALMQSLRDLNLEYRGYTPTIALTGYTTETDERRAMSEGFNAFVHKPFEPAHLVKTVASLLEKYSPSFHAESID